MRLKMIRLAATLSTVVFATACASLPPAKPIQLTDLERLAGDWSGTWHEGPYQGSITLRLDAKDSVGEFLFDTPRGPVRAMNPVAISNGRLMFEGRGSRTTLTLHEEGGRRALAGEYRYASGQAGTIELWKR